MVVMLLVMLLLNIFLLLVIGDGDGKPRRRRRVRHGSLFLLFLRWVEKHFTTKAATGRWVGPIRSPADQGDLRPVHVRFGTTHQSSASALRGAHTTLGVGNFVHFPFVF